MARVALAHTAGIALPLLGVTLYPPLYLVGLLGALVLLFHRPWPLGALVMAFGAGVLSGEAVEKADGRDCRLHLPRRWDGEVEGRFLTRPVPRSSLPFELVSGGPGGCGGAVRAIASSAAGPPPPGKLIRVRASWEGRAFPRPGWGDRAGILRLNDDWVPAGGTGPRGWLLEFRGQVQQRILRLWGEELAPAAEALVLARREHLDPQLREAFALSGTAHLLAISGFHVGVITGLLVGILRLLGCSRLRAETGAVLGCWVYVLGIGAPHAAVRAGVLLSLLLGARLRGRPVMGTGALGAALLILLAVQPGWLRSVGFQLSFAGTGGLVLVRGAVAAGTAVLARFLTGRDLPRRRSADPGARMLRGGADGAAAGIAATLPTLPLLAWHFDRISLTGIPATLVVAPVTAAVIPGIGFSLLLSLLPGGLGEFAAGGTGLLLDAMSRFVLFISRLPGASVWIARETLVGALLAGGALALVFRRMYARAIRPAVRGLAAALAGLIAAVVIPLLPLRTALELHVIDVGQGDAVALRFPSGRWMLVDTGPRSPNFDAGARRVVPYLRRQGVDRLEAIVLTHPHLDHVGGAPAVLRALDVRGVLDPSLPIGSRDYLEVLEGARESGASWWPARSGLSFGIEDTRLAVVHPGLTDASATRGVDPNDLSVVLVVEWRGASVLLTGDAPAQIERDVLDQLSPTTVLKVGHHGSRTSTSPELLDRTRPQIAVVTVGDGNRFRHPHTVVMDRLEAAGTAVYRTDRDGDIRLKIRADGTVDVRYSR